MLAVVLVLAPLLADAGDVRLAAAGVGEHEVVWTVDGVEVARTGDREAVTVRLAAGEHEVRASSDAQAAWQALARLDGDAAGAMYVPAWTAQHVPDGTGTSGDHGGVGGVDGLSWRRLPVLASGLAVAAVVLLAWPARGRRGLEARRRARR